MTHASSDASADRSPALYFFDDARARAFEPFALARPISTLVAGTQPIYTRWQVGLQARVGGFLGTPYLSGFEDPTGGPSDALIEKSGSLPAGSILINSRFAPKLEKLDAIVGEQSEPTVDRGANIWRADGRVVAVRLSTPVKVDTLLNSGADFSLDQIAGSGRTTDIPGWWHDEVWDFVRLLQTQLIDDISGRLIDADAADSWPPPAHSTVIGSHSVVVFGEAADSPPGGPAAVVEPHVVFDASAGPIFIGARAHIRAYSRITGPCYVGPGSTIVGGDVSGCSIGPMCKVRGEMSTTIILGFSNKGHDGFIGHSYLGQWVNIGAGTITSNLKNTYGTVALWTPQGVRDTGLQFLGTLFGDHVKTGIGMRLTTGTVLGAGANVYGDTMPPKVVPPFAWGDAPPYSVYRLDKFLESAERMMSRRHVELSPAMRTVLTAAHEARWTPKPDQE